MKKIIALLAGIFLLSVSYSANNVAHPKLNASQVFFQVGNTGKLISLKDLTNINVEDFQLLTGRKMDLVDKIGFKAAQKKVRNMINLDGTINNKKMEKYSRRYSGETGFHGGGFALGFFLGGIGVLIAYLINDDYKRNRVKWSWIGFAVGAAISIVIIIAAASSVDVY